MSNRQEIYNDILLQRGIDTLCSGDKPCDKCGGLGVAVYGNTTTWRHGIGGQAMTSDICDKCWGSGNKEKPWLNLRELGSGKKYTEAELQEKLRQQREACLAVWVDSMDGDDLSEAILNAKIDD